MSFQTIIGLDLFIKTADTADKFRVLLLPDTLVRVTKGSSDITGRVILIQISNLTHEELIPPPEAYLYPSNLKVRLFDVLYSEKSQYPPEKVICEFIVLELRGVREGWFSIYRVVPQ